MRPINALRMRQPTAGGGFGPTSYANSGGTGNRTGSLTISNNGISIGGQANFNFLIDGSQADVGWWASTGTGANSFKVDFGTARLIDAIKWYQSNTVAHGTWRMEGSNDNSSWTQVGSDFSWNPTGGSSGTEFTFTNSTGYRYYRWRHMSGTASTSPFIREIEFKIS